MFYLEIDPDPPERLLPLERGGELGPRFFVLDAADLDDPPLSFRPDLSMLAKSQNVSDHSKRYNF